MSNLKVNTINDASGGSAAVLYGVASPPNSMGFRNRILNGGMVIDQRNNGAAITNIGTDPVYTVDRFRVSVNSSARFTAQQITDAPAGFVNSLRITTTTVSGTLTSGQYNGVIQVPEGFNCADFGFGAAGASTITVSFWAKSSLAGTFPFSIRNYDATRSYVTTFSLPSANTWTYVTLTIPGDTSGTWNKTNSGWGYVSWTLGDATSTQTATLNAWQAGNYTWSSGVQQPAGTLNATFQITGVQLEAGTVASPFERRDYGRELMMCQRYYLKVTDKRFSGWQGSGSDLNQFSMLFPVTMRAAPSVGVDNGPYPSDNNVASHYSSNITPGGFTYTCNKSGGGYFYTRWDIIASIEL